METARLYGKNESSIHEVMNNKEKICVSFSVAPQTAKLTAIAHVKGSLEKHDVYCLRSALMEKHNFYCLVTP
jgi:hypothetical protein